MKKRLVLEKITCHHIEIMSMKAMTSKAKVLSTAHISVRPMYIHKNNHLGA